MSSKTETQEFKMADLDGRHVIIDLKSLISWVRDRWHHWTFDVEVKIVAKRNW